MIQVGRPSVAAIPVSHAPQIPLVRQGKPSVLFAPLAIQPEVIARFRSVVMIVCGLFLGAICLLGVGLTGGAKAGEAEFLCLFFGLPLGLILGCVISGFAMWSGRRLRAWIWLLALPVLTAAISLAIAPPLGLCALTAFASSQNDLPRLLERHERATVERGGDVRFAPARALGTSLLKKRFRQAAAKLAAGSGPDRDDKLCRELAAAIEGLAKSGDSKLYIDIQEAHVADELPKGTVELAALLSPGATYRGQKAELLDSSVVTGDGNAAERRKLIMQQIEEALAKVIDQQLVKPVLLAEGESREGKLIVEVHATYRMTADISTLRVVNAVYLMRSFDVNWELRLRNQNAEAAASLQTTTKLGELGSVQVKPYSIAHDAYTACLQRAYGDFGKELQAKLGVAG